MAFLFGLMLVVTALLPGACGRGLPPNLEEDFARYFEGTLEIGRADLTWWSPLRFERVVLRDPDGQRVVELDLQLPGFFQWGRESEDDLLGPILVDLDSTVRVDADGLSNFERTFEVREEWKSFDGGYDVTIDEGGFSIRESAGEDPFSIRGPLEFLVSVQSFEWSDVRGPQFELVRTNARVVNRLSGRLEIEAEGEVLGAPEARWKLRASAPSSTALFTAERPLSPTLELRATAIPTKVVASFLGLDRKQLAALGPDVERLFLTLKPEETEEARLALYVELEGGATTMSAEGWLDDRVPALGEFWIR
jgi:hypothetical protein